MRAALWNECPGCKHALGGHRYVSLAVTVAEPWTRERVAELIQAYREQGWQQIVAFNDFLGQYDALKVVALECASQKHTLLLVRDPAASDDSDELIDWQPVAPRAWAALLDIAGEPEWSPFADSNRH